MEKMTYVGALSAVLTSAMQESNPEVYEKLSALKASLEKRAGTKSTKPSKASVEAAEFAQKVLEAMEEAGAPVKCGEVAKWFGVSGQKASAALAKLVKAGEVTKTVEKNVAWFTVAGPDVE